MTAGLTRAVAFCEQTSDVGGFEFAADQFVSGAPVVFRCSAVSRRLLWIALSPFFVYLSVFFGTIFSSFVLYVALRLTVCEVIGAHNFFKALFVVLSPSSALFSLSFWVALSVTFSGFFLLLIAFFSVGLFARSLQREMPISILSSIFMCVFPGAREATHRFCLALVNVSIFAQFACEVVREAFAKSFFASNQVGCHRSHLSLGILA